MKYINSPRIWLIPNYKNNNIGKQLYCVHHKIYCIDTHTLQITNQIKINIDACLIIKNIQINLDVKA